MVEDTIREKNLITPATRRRAQYMVTRQQAPSTLQLPFQYGMKAGRTIINRRSYCTLAEYKGADRILV